MNNPIPQTAILRTHEASMLRSLRDSDAVPRQWRRNNRGGWQADQTTRNLQLLQRQVNNLKRKFGEDDGGFAAAMTYPFQIYPSPKAPAAWLTDNGLVAEDQWRFFRVRAGRVGYVTCEGTDSGVAIPGATAAKTTHPAYTGNIAHITDSDPDRAGVPEFDGDLLWEGGDPAIDFVVGQDTLWYVWIDYTVPTAPWINNSSTAPAGAHWEEGGNWGDYCLVGTIDTHDLYTSRIPFVAIVRQYTRHDVWVLKGCADGQPVNIFV